MFHASHGMHAMGSVKHPWEAPGRVMNFLHTLVNQGQEGRGAAASTLARRVSGVSAVNPCEVSQS
jgi:hypothetical protein